MSYAFPTEADSQVLGVPFSSLPGRGLRRIGGSFRLPCWEKGELAAFVFWPADRPDCWTCGARTALGFDAWALGPIADEPLPVSRTPAAWLARPDSWCPLARDPKQLGVDMLAAGRGLTFANSADAAWAWACIRSVTMPAAPALYVEAA